jgi:drug/metabolite transporter (DMT)-like permease
MSLASAALVSAESILALTPIAIKKSPLNPTSAILSRILSSAVLGYSLTGDRSLPQKEWAGATALGYTNLLHVATSYESFRNLPAGQAMSLLYTYPLWNLVFASIFSNKETIKTREYWLIGLATIGSILLNMDPGVSAPNALGSDARPGWGVFMGIIMALTESGMHTMLKALDWRDPAKSVWVVNSSASAWMFAILGMQELIYDGKGGSVLQAGGTWWDALLLTAFHSVTLFSGYWLRFFAVPRLSTATYSILSYAGLLASYVYGIFFLNERPGWLSVLGALIIMASGLIMQLGFGPV